MTAVGWYLPTLEVLKREDSIKRLPLTYLFLDMCPVTTSGISLVQLLLQDVGHNTSCEAIAYHIDGRPNSISKELYPFNKKQ